MLERISSAAVGAADPGIGARRAVVAALNAATMAALLWLAAATLSPGGYGLLDWTLLVSFAVILPWTVVGFWNAVIGLCIMRLAGDPVALVFPTAASVRGDEAITASTAILVCIRNEMPDRVVRNLEPMLGGLVEAKVAGRFHVYVLSDTSDPAIAAAEEKNFGVTAQKWQGEIGLTYRRRARNTGFKAGNIRDFCNRWGERHDFAVTLDADSLMTPQGILQLVRIMQKNHALGILQSLVIGMPSTSAFARIFQFGMRLGMRSYTIGSAWWQGDCGPYWGHNAILRLAPFMAHCRLPVLPGRGVLGGHVLSHDQIEAVLMRRAGYDVRVLPDETLGWEENPPTLIEFIRRDLRWCQGNLQYWRFLLLPGLKPVSRFQLAIALLMFLGAAAARHRDGGALGRSRRRAARRLRVDVVAQPARDVVCAEDRHRDRRAGQARAAAGIWRSGTLCRRIADRDRFLRAALADPVVLPQLVLDRARLRPRDGLDRADAR